MINFSDAQIWTIIGILAVCTYLIRFSFLGIIGDKPMPPLVTKLLRYTPVAVLPGMVAPLVLWPAATGGVFDAPRAIAAVATLTVAYLSKNVIWGMLAGGGALYAGLIATGQL